MAEVRPAGLAVLMFAAVCAGAVLRTLRVPNGWLIGPLIAGTTLTAFGVELSSLPCWVLNGGQLLIGCALGSRFDASLLCAGPRLLGSAGLCVGLGIALSAGFGAALAWMAGIDGATTMWRPPPMA